MAVNDLIVRLKTNILRKKRTTEFRYNKLNSLVLDCLYREGFISGYKVDAYKIIVYLKYSEDGGSVIRYLKHVSKPSHRVYKSFKRLKLDARKERFYIISSDKGVVYTYNFTYVDHFSGGEVLMEIN